MPEPVVSDSQVDERLAEALGRCRLASEGGAYTAILEDRARHVARDRRVDGALAGMTLAIKDMVAVRGQRLGAGSRTREGAPPCVEDAPVVRALLEAGAIPIGMTAMHELAFGVTGINRYTGTPGNPAGENRVPGGSSSGSAVAVATGSADLAIGTDTGGSIRIPAALCGVVGYKPPFGRIPTAGVLPLSGSLDHVGFLARTVSGVVRADRTFGSVGPPLDRRPHVAVCPSRVSGSDPEVAERFVSAIEGLPTHCEVSEVELPSIDEVTELTSTIMFFEAAQTYGHLAEDDSGLGDDVRTRLETGLRVTADAYREALDGATRMRAALISTLGRFDAVLEPTVPIVAPTFETAPDLGLRLVAHTRLANLCGLPSITLPIAGSGLPVGLQLTSTGPTELLGSALFVEALLAGHSPVHEGGNP